MGDTEAAEGLSTPPAHSAHIPWGTSRAMTMCAVTSPPGGGHCAPGWDARKEASGRGAQAVMQARHSDPRSPRHPTTSLAQRGEVGGLMALGGPTPEPPHFSSSQSSEEGYLKLLHGGGVGEAHGGCRTSTGQVTSPP